ncbi:hypothetical protein [Halobaculum limi]|uniref:hypothetical protein n=1 Tax=Halobaculum limi TaxID=3031916 RepID=UPI002404B88B|nr:hypothetical protein [Halobaculum sp. YSMS11]
MLRPETRTASIAALAAFLLVFGGLTAHRVFDVGLPTAIQSALVWTGAAVVVTAVATISYREWRFIDCWIVALGPTLGFTVNLFEPFTSPTGATVALSVYATVTAAVVASVLALVGYTIGASVEGVVEVDDRN